MAQKPIIAVHAASDAFAQVWPDLAASARAELRAAESLAQLAPLRDACGVLLVLAGAEAGAAEAVARAREAGADRMAVVGSAADHRLAVGALRAGAQEYFALPEDLEALRGWLIERAEAFRADRRVALILEADRAKYDFSRMVGTSQELRQALDRAARIIPHGAATVLITGDTGTGKELLAQAIHYNGPRAAHPFVEVNCTALPPSLLEAELFGYERGAFTDARAAKPGLFEAAHRGTLFLDEIGDLGLEAQAKLLKVLENGRVRRLGSVRTIDIDVRIIAATHIDLPAAVRESRFREDLWYRLSVVRLHLPPLRERGDDVIVLAEHFLDRFAKAYAVERPPLSHEARAALGSHDWPGNVRELRNAMERALLLGGGRIDPADLFAQGLLPPRATEGGLPFPASLEAISRAAAQAMLDHYRGNKSAAAGALGVSRSRLYRLLTGAS